MTERFSTWEHVNVQRGVDAYLAARQRGMDREEAEWFGPPGGAHHPHENLLSMITTPPLSGTDRANASVSPALAIKPKLSRSHCMRLPATKTEPSSA